MELIPSTVNYNVFGQPSTLQPLTAPHTIQYHEPIQQTEYLDTVPSGLVTTSKSKPYCTIRINNAAHSNVLNKDVISQLTDAFEDVSSDDDTRCIILSAEGVHFSAGPSLDEMRMMSKTDAVRWYRAGTTLCNLIENTRQPVICIIQVNGSYGIS